MLADVKNVAFSAVIVMAGLLVLIAAEQAWAVLFLANGPFLMFNQDLEIGSSTIYTEGLIGVVVMIWLVGRMVRRALESAAAGR